MRSARGSGPKRGRDGCSRLWNARYRRPPKVIASCAQQSWASCVGRTIVCASSHRPHSLLNTSSSKRKRQEEKGNAATAAASQEKADLGTANIQVGSVVHFRIQRVAKHLATGEIIAVQGVWCRTSGVAFRGAIRPEDARSTKGNEVCVLSQCFRPGDIVIGEVINTTDTRTYQITTLPKYCGTVQGRSSAGHRLLPMPGAEVGERLVRMRCNVTGAVETRLVPAINN